MWDKKAISLIPVAFVVLATAVALTSYVFYNIYYGGRYEYMIFEQSKFDIIRNEIEKIKGFSKQSLIYSAHLTTDEHARSAGLMSDRLRAWICNGPNPPSFDETKACLEKYTKYYVNDYYTNYTIELPISMSKSEFTNCEYDLNKSEVFEGKYDEGFNVILDGTRVTFTSQDLLISDAIRLNERIDNNRYWYMFRIFYEWAQENVYGECICECTSKCRGCGCAESCARKALMDLQSRFDEYVTCEVGKVCCHREIGVEEPSEATDCLEWEQEECLATCDVKCGEFEIPSFSGEYEIKEEYRFSGSDEDRAPCEFVIVNQPNKLASVHTFWCKDEKYFVPGGEGPHPLVFQVNAFAAYKDLDACVSIGGPGECTDTCVCAGGAPSPPKPTPPPPPPPPPPVPTTTTTTTTTTVPGVIVTTTTTTTTSTTTTPPSPGVTTTTTTTTTTRPPTTTTTTTPPEPPA